MSTYRTGEIATADLTFAAMGTDAHVVVVGGSAGLAERARRRIAELEQRWSRFLPHSEVSRLTRAAGAAVPVSAETRELVERAVAAWELTGGRFDPTVLGAVIRAGYDRPFDELRDDLAAAPRSAARSPLGFGTGAIEIRDDTVRLPVGCGFDPGGLGKGLAADIVVDELRADGAQGACVNLGGDVRVDGISPDGNAWTIAIEHPALDEAIARVGLRRGATATSSTLRRRWDVAGEPRHHLIDPATGEPSTSDLTFVTVVTGHAWAAEVLAKAVLLRGTPHHFDALEETGAAALAVDRTGRVHTTPGMAAYLAEPAPAAISTIAA